MSKRKGDGKGRAKGQGVSLEWMKGKMKGRKKDSGGRERKGKERIKAGKK